MNCHDNRSGKGVELVIMKELEIRCNSYWESAEPLITVITPVYNRRATIQRTMDSVEAQTFRSIEYIIIDDGSSEAIDDIVDTYMQMSKLPVMFIKKENGGVHTARNIGFRKARGTLVLNIDSDDELLPEACDVFWNTWTSIPIHIRKECGQIKAQCKNQNGIITGAVFPEGINEWPIEKARKHFSLSAGEQHGCRSAAIMKSNLFPEPDGVTFVTENIIWVPMEQKYRSWGLNDVVRIYHTEGDDHISTSLNATRRKVTLQDCRNTYWNVTYMANHAEIFVPDFYAYIKRIVRSCEMAHILRVTDRGFLEKNKLEGGRNCFWKTVLWLPAGILAAIYRKRNM